MTPFSLRVEQEIAAAIDAQWAAEFARAEREYFELMTPAPQPPAVAVFPRAA